MCSQIVPHASKIEKNRTVIVRTILSSISQTFSIPNWKKYWILLCALAMQEKKCSSHIVLKSRESRSLNFPALFPKNSLTNYSHAQIVSCHAPKSYEFRVMLCPVQEKFKDNVFLWLFAKKNEIGCRVSYWKCKKNLNYFSFFQIKLF